MEIALRPIEFKKDIYQIMHLEEASFDEEAFDLGEIIYFWQISTNTFWVAYDDEQLAGYVVANIEDDAGYIASIAVDVAYRQRGIGEQLMRKVIDILKSDKNVTHILLHVRESNRAAISLYRKLGFVVDGREVDYYPDNESASRMIYRIVNESQF